MDDTPAKCREKIHSPPHNWCNKNCSNCNESRVCSAQSDGSDQFTQVRSSKEAIQRESLHSSQLSDGSD
jgi:hypothetical protein